MDYKGDSMLKNICLDLPTMRDIEKFSAKTGVIITPGKNDA